jgi:hypothetical protein
MFPVGPFVDIDPGGYLPPDDLDITSTLIEREAGGVSLSDPSEGIDSYTWQCSYVPASGTIALKNLDTAITYVILTGIMNLTDLSFAFDANMRPAIGYRDNIGVSNLYYYNSVTEAYDTITFAAGSGAPRLCHDDKRSTMVLSNITDVLVFYVRGTTMYYRIQRERYVTEHAIVTVTSGTEIKKVGMSEGLRLKVSLLTGAFISSP